MNNKSHKNYSVRSLKQIFQRNSWYMTRKNLLKAGLNRYDLDTLVRNEVITKVTSKLYKWKKINFGEYEDLIDISVIEPRGVFCLYTAMDFYKLSTFVSDKYYLAILRSDWVPKGLEQYPVVIKKWTRKTFSLGIDLQKVGKNTIRIYNLEKTVCDCVRYRNELGLNTLKEILTSYLQKKTKDLQKLYLYAELLGISKVLNNYLGMIL
ncbi:type IV toxin-antitoxin system AbiEi family antitoxin domain-containing protein [Candidatus Harpocratesius sp.]